MLAASYDSSVLVYDCTGEALQPLITRIVSGSKRKQICALEWRNDSNTHFGGGDKLITCTEDVIAQWDLRASKKPNLTFRGKGYISVSCDNHEIASLSAKGVVAIYDDRKNSIVDAAGGGDVLYMYRAHEIGVGIDKLEHHWITWGMEDMDQTMVKIWNKNDAVQKSATEKYWYMDNGPGKDGTAAHDNGNEISGPDSINNTALKCVAEMNVDHLTTVKVLSQSQDQSSSQNAFVTVSSPSFDVNGASAGPGLWQSDLWALSPQSTGDCNVNNLAMFQGGGANDALLSRMVGKDYADGYLIAAELSDVSGNFVDQIDDEKSELKDDERETVLCCMTSTGYLTTHACNELSAHKLGLDEDRTRQKQSPFRYHHVSKRALLENSTKVFGDTADIDTKAVIPSMKTRLGRNRGNSDSDLYKGTSATIIDLGSVEGGIMQFNLDDEFEKDQNLPEKQVSTDDKGLLEQQTKSIPQLEEVDPVKAALVPSPRPCGAVFGADGTLVSFHNGNVNKMWMWYTSDFQVQSPSHLQHESNATVPKASALAFQDLEGEHSGSAESDTTIINNNTKYPRSVWDLMKMNESAKVAQWGKDRDDDDTDDSRQSSIDSDNDSSDSSGSEVSSDSGSDDPFFGTSEKTMYETYFGKFLHSDPPFEKIFKKQENTRDKRITTRPRSESFVGPVTENLEPKVFVTGHLKELVMNGQCPELADRWKLGPWKYEPKRQISYSVQKNAVTATLSKIANECKEHLCTLSYFDLSSNLTPDILPFFLEPVFAVYVTPSRDTKSRNSMVGNLQKLKKSSDLSAVPLDQMIMHKEGTVRFPPEEKIDYSKEIPPSEVIAASSSVRPDMVEIHYLQHKIDICMHNAEVATNIDQHGKSQVWRLIADIIEGIAGNSYDDFDGWHSINGSALGRELILNILHFYETNGDVQMLATIVSVLRSRRQDPISLYDLLFTDDSRRYDLYIHFYSQLLYSWGKLITRVELNKHLSQRSLDNDSTIIENNALSRDKEMFSPCCQLCNRLANPETNICQHCNHYAFRCSICTNAVRGLFTVCITCGHGGHGKWL